MIIFAEDRTNRVVSEGRVQNGPRDRGAGAGHRGGDINAPETTLDEIFRYLDWYRLYFAKYIYWPFVYFVKYTYLCV